MDRIGTPNPIRAMATGFHGRQVDPTRLLGRRPWKLTERVDRIGSWNPIHGTATGFRKSVSAMARRLRPKSRSSESVQEPQKTYFVYILNICTIQEV